LRQGNLTQILRFVRDHGPSSRHDIAHGCGLGISTMTDLIGELRSRRLVKELDPIRRPGAGRPTRPISFDGEPWCVLGMHLDIDQIQFGVTTIGGRELWQETVEEDLDHAGPEAGLAIVERQLRRQLARIGEETSLIAVEVAVPGYVASDRATVSWSNALNWRDVPLHDAIIDILADLGITGVDVGVSNDCHLAALYAARRELDLPSSSIAVYLGGARALGSGLIIGGEVFRGANGGAGDFGHLIVDPAGPGCWCGRSGCLQSLVGLEYLLTSSDLQSADDAARVVKEQPQRAVQLLVDASGSVRVREVLQQAGATLGRAIDGVIGMVNPQAVALGGYLAALSPQLLPTIEERTAGRVDIPAFSATTVIAVEPNVPRVLNGAILSARDACFYDPLALTRPVS
jgi:predicted NBD/HSP70 family sugar kinase